jgi:hypothetical protein
MVAASLPFLSRAARARQQMGGAPADPTGVCDQQQPWRPDLAAQGVEVVAAGTAMVRGCLVGRAALRAPHPPPPPPPCGAQRMRLHTAGSNGGHDVVGDGAAAGSCLGGWVASAAPHPPSSWHEAAVHDGFGGQVVEYGGSSVHVKGGGGATRGRCRSAWMEGVSRGWQSRRPCGLGSSPSLHSGGSDLHRQGDQRMV